jgi:hypothetical protein
MGRVRRLLLVAAALWVGRWALRELAAQIARRLPIGPAPVDSPRQPGRMPGPFDT